MDKEFSELNINRIYLMLGTNCNFKCKYCIQTCMNNYISTKINNDVIKYITHLIDIRPSKYDKIQILFWGGEPLIYLDAIKEIVNIFQNKVEYIIVTNGKLIDKEFVDFVNNNKINVMLSNDGENTKITRGINLLENKAFRELFNQIKNRGIDSVISAYNQDYIRLKKYIIDKIGDKYIAPEFLLVNWEMPKELYNFDLDKYKKHIYDVSNKAFDDIINGKITYEVNIFLNTLQKIVNGLQATNNLPNCRQTYNNMNIDLNGNVYVCHNSSIKIGTIKDSRYKLLNNYNQWLNTRLLEKCLECQYYALCKGSCPLELKTKQEDKYNCAVYKIYYQACIDLANRLNFYFEPVDLEME